MSEITKQPLYLIKFDDTEVPDETMFGAEVANKRFEQISGSWNAHLFLKVASNSRDDSCSGSNAKLASDYDALAAQRDEGLAREAELKKELAQFQDGYTEQWQSREALQQRLAEAKRLLLDVRGQLCGPDQRAIDAFLASSCCADGENYACSNCNGTKRVHVDKGWTLPCSVCADGEKAE